MWKKKFLHPSKKFIKFLEGSNMMQIYFLSILFNLVAGLILLNKKNTFSGNQKTPVENEDPLSEDNAEQQKKNNFIEDFGEKLSGNKILENKSFIITCGILAVLTGILKLFCVVERTKVFGDFIPCIAGIAGGFTILFNYYLNNSTVTNNFPPILNKIFVNNAYYIGLFCMAASILHFFFAKALFL